MTKPLLLQFRDTFQKPNDEGLKLVLFKLTEGGRFIGYDYGFANYTKEGFETLGGADSPLCTVVMWSETPSPQLLLG